MRLSHIFLAVLLVPGLCSAHSFSAKAKGTTTAEFLTLGVGARAIGMGEAYVAAADEASALYWNPAALTRLPSLSATFMHAAYLDSSFFNYGAISKNLGRLGAFAFGVQYFSAGKLTQTDPSGNEIGYFTPYNLSVSLGYGRALESLGGLSVGVAAKFVRSEILTSAQTGAVDIGILSPKLLQDRLSLALVVSNLGGKMRFVQARENLPLVIKAGAALNLHPRWLVTTDMAFPRDDDPYGALGAEWRLWTGPSFGLTVRTGLNSRTLKDIDGITGLSSGLGLAFGNIRMDYAFVPFGGLGLTHRVSLSFGLPRGKGNRQEVQPRFSVGPEPSGDAVPKAKTMRDHLENANDFILLRLYEHAENELQLARETMTRDLEFGAYHERIGRIRFLQGKISAAEEAYIKALRVVSSKGISIGYAADAYIGLARCKLVQGNKDQAILYLKKSLETQPTQNIREEVLRMLKDLGAI